MTIAIFWLSLLAWIGLELWRQARDLRAVSIQVKADRGSIWLTTGLTVAGIAIGFAGGRTFGWYMPGRTSMALFVAGIALMWLGIALRLWSIGTLGRFFHSQVVIQKDHALISTGPYRFLRHPSYAGAVLTALGAGIVLANWFSLLAFLVIPLVGYLRRIQIEEEALLAGLGSDYRTYTQQTWRLVPFVW